MRQTAASRKRGPTRRGSSANRGIRAGRPRRERAGEVEERILDAARNVFLERGLAGASMEEIAALARAGKPTIYTRFPSKEALFTAVVMRSVDANISRLQSNVPAGTTIEDRLASVSLNVLHWILVSDAIGLMRLAVAEARRFPALASTVHQMAHEHATETVARLFGEAAQSDALGKLPAFAPERIEITTRFFLDLVLLPLLMRALFGENLDTLCAQIGPHVAGSVAFFLAACRHGGVD